MAVLSDENKQLFGEQVNDHIEKLNDLMGFVSGEAFEENKVRKACLATRLLEGSTEMLDLNVWSCMLEMFRRFMEMSLTSGRCWDEQISQVVSEILEAEEQEVAEILTGEFEANDHEERFLGLQREMEVLLGESLETESNEKAPSQDVPVSVEAPEEPEHRLDNFPTLDRLMESLRIVKSKFGEYLEDPNRGIDTIRNLEIAFGESEFFLDLVGDILMRLGDNKSPFQSKVHSRTVLDGVRDFFNLHGALRNWNAELKTRCDDFSLDREAASTLVVILNSCLFDIGKMYEVRSEFNLDVNLDIVNEGSYLKAKIVDNGPDFLCDSEIDRDDAVAFYQCLLSIRGLLKKLGGLLWIEPSHGKDGRFQFTFPYTAEVTEYNVFTASGKNLALPCHCIDCVLELEGCEIIGEGNERHVIVSQTRIPVYSLDELAAEEVEIGKGNSHMIVIGIAEERVGILSEGPGRKVEGIPDQLTEGNCASLTKHFLHLGEEEFPVLDIQLVLNKIKYLEGLDGALGESGSFSNEGVVPEGSEDLTVPCA